MFRKVIIAGSIVVLAAGSTACATKGFVRQNVGEVNDKVDTLSRSVEENQERTKANESRIGEVDQPGARLFRRPIGADPGDHRRRRHAIGSAKDRADSLGRVESGRAPCRLARAANAGRARVVPAACSGEADRDRRRGGRGAAAVSYASGSSGRMAARTRACVSGSTLSTTPPSLRGSGLL